MTVISLPKKSHGVVHSPEQLQNTLNYITNPEKTDNYELVSGQNIQNPVTAFDEMLQTRDLAILSGQTPRKNERYAFHFIQSFSPDDDLTPQQVHEIGLKTMKKYLGESVEFVIATHQDREHLHNHIVLNATNPKTLKKFQQSQIQFEELKEISDSISKEYGAKIIPHRLQNSHKKYQVYLAQRSLRKILEKKLSFLITHSKDWQDFKVKADILKIDVDDSNKYVTYKLRDTDQKQNIRDRSLKNKKYLRENITDVLEQNKTVISPDEIKTLWEQQESIESKQQEHEVEILVEDWQIEKETDKYLYINVDYGLNKEQSVKIPARQVDRLENGDFKLFLKGNDRYYFLDKNNPEKNRIMKGTTLARNIQSQSGNVPLYSDNASVKLSQLFNEFEFLISKGIEFDKSFESIGQDLLQTFEDTENTIDELDNRILFFVEKNKHKPSNETVKTIKSITTRRDRLKDELFKVKRDITVYQKSSKRLDSYEKERQQQKNQRPHI